jgi:beta-N-acetylhexosaminidase
MSQTTSSRSTPAPSLTCGASAAAIALVVLAYGGAAPAAGQVSPTAGAEPLGSSDVRPLGRPVLAGETVEAPSDRRDAPLGQIVATNAAANSEYAADVLRDREVPPESVGFDAERFSRVDSVIRHALREGASPGAALVVGRHGRFARLRGYGHTDWGQYAPQVTDSTLYDLASLTKAMGTATVAIQMASEGRLLLDAPIHRYLPAWPSRGLHGDITVRHLLAHTSGLPAGADLWPGWRPRGEIIRSLGELKVWSRPGTHREYSDVGMILLGAVLEEVSDSRLDDLL